MARTPILLLLPALLAACHARVGRSADAADNGADVRLAMGDGAGGKEQVAVKLPGFSATMKLPAMDLGGHMDVDGIKLAAGSKVEGMDVAGHDAAGGDDGKVELRFTNPQPPAALVGYYRRAAEEAGYTVAAASGDALTATKGDRHLVLAVAADGSGSRGRIDLAGR